MESLRPAHESPCSALFSSRELNAEAVAYLSHRSDTFLIEASQWQLEDLPAYIESGLFSRSSKAFAFGAEELRFMRESCRGDLEQAEDALNFLLEHGLLKAESGYARFVAPFSDWESKWRGKVRREGLSKTASRLLDILASLGAPLREDECREIMGLGNKSISWVISELEQAGCIDTNVEEDLIQMRGRLDSEGTNFTLDQSLFPKLWDRCGERMESKLLLLAHAVKQNVSPWFSALPGKMILELADKVSLSALSNYCHRVSGKSAPSFLGILPCVERLRSKDLPEALEVFWFHEAELDLPESAELSRRLVNDLIDHKSTDEGLECQERWKRVRAKEIEGSEFEVRVAAREAMTHGRMGSMDSALELLEHYKKQFAGRDGYYYLDWAEGLISHDRLDRVARGNAIQRALEGMPEDAELRDRFSLHIQLAGSLTLLGNHKQARIHLDQAEALMRQSKNLELGMHVSIARGLYEKTRGNLKESIRLYFLAIRQAKANGSWQVPMVIQTNLVYALLRNSDFSRLMPLSREISRQVEVTDQISNATAGRLALAKVCIAFGRFEEARKHINEYLLLSEEIGSRSKVAIAFLRRVYLFRLWGKKEAAKADLERLARDFREDMSPAAFTDMRLEVLLNGESNPEDLVEEELAAILFSTEETGSDYLRAEALIARIILRRRRGDLSGAMNASKEALDFVMSLDIPSLLWSIYYERGEVEVLQGERSAARKSFGQAVEIIEGLSRRFSRQDDRDCFLGRPDQVHVLKRYQSLG
jgi:tetratricopeptide (TPR) repeat protein